MFACSHSAYFVTVCSIYRECGLKGVGKKIFRGGRGNGKKIEK